MKKEKCASLKIEVVDEIKLKEIPILDYAEFIVDILSVPFPLLSFVGRGFKLKSKELMRENLQVLVDKLNENSYKIRNFELKSETEERNFIFNVRKILRFTVEEKVKSKIEIFANILANSIFNEEIYKEQSVFDDILAIIEVLTINDIILLKKLNDFKGLLEPDSNYHIPVQSYFIEAYQTINGKFHSNENGFGDYDVLKLEKLISYGLVEKTDVMHFGAKQEGKVQYEVTRLYDLFKEYIKD